MIDAKEVLVTVIIVETGDGARTGLIGTTMTVVGEDMEAQGRVGAQ